MITADKLRFRGLNIDELRIPPGITSVIGPNGSGKTTLLKLLAGILLPESGTIAIDDLLPRDAEIGWVNEFPDRNILFSRVVDEIASPLRFRHLACSVVEEQAESIMECLGITPLKTRSMGEISGGEKVLVAIAAALIIRPQVLVLDEYDSHLDLNRAGEITRIIRGSRIPYVIHCTQDIETAASGNAVIFLDKGRIRFSGDPKNVFASLAGTPYYPLSWKCST